MNVDKDWTAAHPVSCEPGGKARVVLPGAVIGVLGGGQLGRMMALAGRAMGYRFVTLDPTADAPCGQVADEQIVAGYADLDAARRLGARADVITYEFENVDAEVARVLEETSYVPQGSRLLAITQHRLREKAAVAAAGAPVAAYAAVDSWDSLLAAVERVGLPAVLKTTTGGYDGKGQWLLRSRDDAERAWQEFAGAADRIPAAGDVALDAPLILEQFVAFETELSVVVARTPQGQMCSFPVAENIHRHHILHMSIVPARIPDAIQREAQRLAERIAEALGVVGLLAVEMFLDGQGRLYVNELAPRPHNSGHYTIDACATSQFEQHIRAICNLPLGRTTLLTPVVMVNILGEHVQPVLERLPAFPDNVKWHWYGKAQAKPKRKMGHINVIADTVDAALAQINALGVWGPAADK